ncbi:NADH-quinone oxidoreductase subunit J [Candidatus Hakubella thermalkaliphila]|uniref:NADH-quinone oxidoreductase subunit J n=1 Tax=Candidatus Hakubella thermalkaliphila TaxID=2754717 RepID=A0A6V8PB60_9ACTN|nr:NADH-quinone oxidoreductase subunit J [Candidatus Hakubella thermalkaliphila]GFP28096.1 NADH-quinone oxidoreductase subunit J [Candidatus Hakubella thermalkaliphila]GFP34719.1 NADH-quinone oxidoreductase subunit J [Candidatus Hakubella thermalkaliphila]
MEISTVQLVAFGIVTAIMLISALLVVTARNIVHAVFFLIVTLFCVAGYFILLLADFLAAVQILIYVGAVVALIVFGLILTRARVGQAIPMEEVKQKLWAILVSLIFFGGVSYALLNEKWPVVGAEKMEVTTTSKIADTLFNTYVLPFQVTSVLLLAVLIGAIVLAMREEK